MKKFTEEYFENYIESLKMLADKKLITIMDYAKVVNELCEEFGEERVMSALRTNKD